MPAKPKQMTHVGMVQRAQSRGWSNTEFAPTWLRETPKCWIAEDGCKWPKEKKQSYGSGNAKRVYAKKPGTYGDTRYALDLTTVRMLTTGEFRKSFLDAYTGAKRVLNRAQERLENAEQARSDAFDAALRAKTDLDRFDREHDIHEESPYE